MFSIISSELVEEDGGRVMTFGLGRGFVFGFLGFRFFGVSVRDFFFRLAVVLFAFLSFRVCCFVFGRFA